MTIEMIIATAVAVSRNPNARIPAYILNFDVGALGERYKSSAQLVSNYNETQLEGKQLLVVANFPRKQIGKMKSDCLTVAVQDPTLETPDLIRETNIVVETSIPVPNASSIVTDGSIRLLTENLRDLTWEKFLEMEVIVGTILEYRLEMEMERKLEEVKNDIMRYSCKVDLGIDGKGIVEDCSLIMADSGFDLDLHSKRQVLVQTRPGSQCHILTVSGISLLHPERPVKNGIKLA